MERDDNGAIPVALAQSKVAWHSAQASLPVREKFRILLQLQEQVAHRLSVSGFLAEIDRMQLEVREYLSLHPADVTR